MEDKLFSVLSVSVWFSAILGYSDDVSESSFVFLYDLYLVGLPSIPLLVFCLYVVKLFETYMSMSRDIPLWYGYKKFLLR